VYVQPRGSYRNRGIYNNYYYYNYPRRYYPYGYGAFGLGYFYYDPYVWRGNSWGSYGSAGYPYLGYGNGYELGHLRLDVRPRDAEVYIDGYYAGIVDDFDGRLQGLALETGGYTVEIVAPGLEPLTFDIRITPGRTTTYRGQLLPQP
jgi:PEGA domain-containing protein